MKFVVFADKTYNFIKPMADGLADMLQAEKQDYEIYYDGICWLRKPNLLLTLLIDIARFFMNLKSGNRKLYVYRFWHLLTFMNAKRKKQLQECDCIIVVLNCPTAFYKHEIRLEALRRKFNKPIVNYDLHYLPNQGWYKKIKERSNDNYGLERYDWYLPASLMTEYALPREIPIIYSNIGFNLRKDNLFPEQKEFVAVVDFRRKGYEKERAVQIQALKETNTPYIELDGRYTSDEIRKIYRSCSMYFVAFRESFGLPVIELQLCGSTIFTPYNEWLPAHFIDKSIYEAGIGKLGKNFHVYNNDLETLKESIIQLKKTYNAETVIRNFEEEYPDYYSYNKQALSDFIDKISASSINEKSHLNYSEFNSFISTNDDITIY